MEKVEKIRGEAEQLVAKYNSLIQSKHIPDNFKFELEHNLKETQRILAEDEIRIAVGGETSSGKTTFLNKFFSTNLFYTTQEEATAVPTEVRKAETLKVIVYGESERIIKTIEPAIEVKSSIASPKIIEELRNEIELYTSVKHQINGVTKVEVLLPIESMPQKMVLIDTPGFNAHESRAKIATQVIDNSHACLFVIDARNALKKREMDVIKMTQAQTAKTYFILNKMDQLSEENEFDTDSNSDLSVIEYTRAKLREMSQAEDLVLVPVSSKSDNDIPVSAIKYAHNLHEFKTRFYDDIQINKLSYLGDFVARKSGELAKKLQTSTNDLAVAYEKELAIFVSKVPKSVENVQSEIIGYLQTRYDTHFNAMLQHLVKLIDEETDNLLREFAAYISPITSKSQIENSLKLRVSYLIEGYLKKVKSGIVFELNQFSDKLSGDIWLKVQNLYSAIPGLKRYKTNNGLGDFEKTFKPQGLHGSFSTGSFDFSFEKEIGIGGAGAAIGMVVFGPIGAIIGGALGWMFGNNIGQLKEQIATKFYEEVVKIRQSIIQEFDNQLSDNINGVLSHIEGQIDSQISTYFTTIEDHRQKMIKKIENEHKQRKEIILTLEEISKVGNELLYLRKRAS